MNEHLNWYLQAWDLHDPQTLADSPRGTVYTAYRDGEKVVLKLFTAIGVEDEADGMAALRYFDGQGAVRLLAHDDAGPAA